MKHLFTLFSAISTMLLLIATNSMAIPPHPQMLQDRLAVGDTVGYFHLIEAGRPLPEVAQFSTQKALAPQRVGRPNLPSKALLVLVEYEDVHFQPENTRESYQAMFNGTNYHDNGAPGSAKEYFQAQSNGAYSPEIVVVGPLCLPHPMAYYGGNSANTKDSLSGQMVLDACSMVAAIDSIDLHDFDSDNDGALDLFFVVYAGWSEAAYGPSDAIWPHNWTIQSAIYYGNTVYPSSAYNDYSLFTFDGVYLDEYSCSNELYMYPYMLATGIGVFCHEYEHAMGLPDLYDTSFGVNYSESRAAQSWDVMCVGMDNNYGITPPNFSPWEKAFFGWANTDYISLESGQDTVVTIYANGSAQQNIIQLNEAGHLLAWNDTATAYCLEYRQQSGWDEYVPTHGMLIWRVRYDPVLVDNNTWNNIPYQPGYTIVSSHSRWIGDYVAYPGVSGRTECNNIPHYTIDDITEYDDHVTLHITRAEPPAFNFSIDAENKLWVLAANPETEIIYQLLDTVCSDTEAHQLITDFANTIETQAMFSRNTIDRVDGALLSLDELPANAAMTLVVAEAAWNETSHQVVLGETGVYRIGNPPTALEQITTDTMSGKVQKIIHNGQLIIIREGKHYNAAGIMLK